MIPKTKTTRIPYIRRLPASIDVSSGSVIMAIGIFLIGAIQQFSFLDLYFGNYLTYLLILTWFILLITFFRSLLRSEYRQYIMTNPITIFGAGTWIASTSVVGNLIINRLPGSLPFVKVLLLFNLFLWGFFIILCIRQLITIMKKGLILETHGVLLLSTVSTQSIACLISKIHSPAIPPALISSLIIIGAAFYLISAILLSIRFSSNYRNIHEWKNTDCIIHGAISITGLSMTLSGHFSFNTLIIVWIIGFSLFIIVEIFEVIRAFMRIKAYGWKNGIFTYHVSQWSRNFTFGMFYLFTVRMIDHYSSFQHPLIFQTHFIQVLGWVVLFLLIVEVSILITSKTRESLRRDVSKSVSV